jgi:hypothetical protein
MNGSDNAAATEPRTRSRRRLAALRDRVLGPGDAPPAWLVTLRGRLLERRVRKGRELTEADRAALIAYRQSIVERDANRLAGELILMATILDTSPELRAMVRRALRVKGTEEVSNPTIVSPYGNGQNKKPSTDPKKYLQFVRGDGLKVTR